MVVLKSAPLNARFLSSTPTNSVQPPAARPSVPSVGATGSAPSAPVLSQTSKLKFTTTRGSGLRSTREASPVPSSADGTPGAGLSSTGEKKAPVWNKGMPVKKSAKDYTDEELKAMHGISLVSRTVTDSSQNRWDDSDEDDDWDDTIDFGDGTKVVVSQIQPTKEAPKVEPKKVVAPAPQRVAVELPARVTPPVVRSTASPASVPIVSKPPGNPWKKPESSEPPTSLKNIQHDFPAMGEAAPASKPGADYGRGRSDSASYGNSSADRTQYQYEQNNFDRRWQQPQPSTREIFNYTTGQFEQIDASSKRRPSQHEGRARPGLLQKIAASVNKDAARRASKEETPPASATEPSKTTAPTANAASVPAKAEVPSETAPPVIDPSSAEFIEMQKKLMADSRAQAILRRKQQDEEEIARRERARKKAEELAAQAEKEAAEEKAAKEAKAAKAKQEAAAKLQQKQAQKAAAEDRPAPNDKLEETWQRGVKLPERKNSQDVRVKKPSMSGPTSSFQRAAEDSPIDGEKYAAPQRNVWGPIGPKQGQLQEQQQQQRQTPASQENSDSAPSVSPAAQSSRSEPTAGSWNAFDGMSSRRPQVSLPGSTARGHDSGDSWKQVNAHRNAVPSVQGSARELVDVADEVLPLERNAKQSPQGPGQSTRTSSRFFPSPAGNPIKRPGTAGSQEFMAGGRQFISPILPPVTEDTDLFSKMDVPALRLPSATIKTNTHNQEAHLAPLSTNLQNVMQAIRAKARPRTAALTEREIYGKLGYGWLETQTRTVWEVLPPRFGAGSLRPRVNVARRGQPIQAHQAPIQPGARSTAAPARTPWALPTTLEVTSRANGTTEPLVPLKPSLSLPAQSPDVSPMRRKRQPTREHTKTYVVTRQDLAEAPDFSSPIRIKTTGQAKDTVQVPRKYGKRLDLSRQDSKKADVQRQPKNMSDHGHGHGFHRGFASRVRVSAPAATNGEGQVEPSQSQSQAPGL